MRIFFIGKFQQLYDEEYIARSFEMLGHEVIRAEQVMGTSPLFERIIEAKPDFVLFTKFNRGWETVQFIKKLKELGIKTVCWVFDIYWGYEQEFGRSVQDSPFFRAEYVFTTDGGNEDKWKRHRINHACVRQGIFKEQCFALPFNDPKGVCFVGSGQSNYPGRMERINLIKGLYGRNFQWFGKKDTNEVRNEKLNELYSTVKIVIGDSAYSPNYWSNRVVETLGRGGFLIHQDVPGIKEEYPHLVTYQTDNLTDLKGKIDYYLRHEDERREIVVKNFEWVRDRYTMDKKCAELISYINETPHS